MGDKAKQRTERWKKRLTNRFVAELAHSAIEEYNFKRLKALGIIRKGNNES